jgi:two-component system CheB/CheR fusion protein
MIIETPWKRWTFAVLACVAASGVNVMLQPLVGGRVPLLPYFPALAVTSCCAGLGPGLALLVVAAVEVCFYWGHPTGAYWALPHAGELWLLLVFLIAAGVVVAMAVASRRLLQQARQDRQRLRAVEERLHLALEAGKVTAWETDAERRYTWLYNVQLGLKPSDLLGQRIGTSQRSDDYAGAVDRVYATGESGQFEIELPYQGERLHYLCYVRAEKDEDGRVVRVIGASVDVTELKVMQEQLRREGQRKDAFLATLAHELRNPMAPIRYAAALLGDNTPPAMREHAREVISRQSAHMARLLEDLLDMSRITRNVIELKREVFDLRGAAEQVADNARPRYGELRHRLLVSLPPEPVLVDGDATRLQQVLGNLLDNAAKYTEPGGEVKLRLEREGGLAVVRVIDNGIGIAPDEQAHVFELFTQVHTPGRGRSGLGIGLAVVKQLVELHGGSVSVRSDGAHRGCEFIVRLPLAQDAGGEESGGAGNVVNLFAQPAHVLVVDDNRDTADSLAALLRARGFAAATAYDGASALDAFAKLKPSIVLLDLGLPDFSGYEVARRLRAQQREGGLILVAITGWGQEKDREQTARAGFDLHLVKPVDPDELEHRIGELAASRRAA